MDPRTHTVLGARDGLPVILSLQRVTKDPRASWLVRLAEMAKSRFNIETLPQ